MPPNQYNPLDTGAVTFPDTVAHAPGATDGGADRTPTCESAVVMVASDDR